MENNSFLVLHLALHGSSAKLIAPSLFWKTRRKKITVHKVAENGKWNDHICMSPVDSGQSVRICMWTFWRPSRKFSWNLHERMIWDAGYMNVACFLFFSDFLLLHLNRMAGKGALAHGPVDLKHKHYFFYKSINTIWSLHPGTAQ